MLFKTSNPPRGILRDRFTVSTAFLGLSIVQICAVIATTIALLLVFTWALECFVLPRIIAITIPLIYKYFSVFSTALLFLFLINNVEGLYIVLSSCFCNVTLHTIFLGAIIEAFINRDNLGFRLVVPSVRKTREARFYVYIALCITRLVLTCALSYYVLILASIRLEGGTGSERKNALDLEIESMDGRMDQLVIRERERKITREILECEPAAMTNNNGFTLYAQ